MWPCRLRLLALVVVATTLATACGQAAPPGPQVAASSTPAAGPSTAPPSSPVAISVPTASLSALAPSPAAASPAAATSPATAPVSATSASPAPAGNPSALTVAEVYRRVEQTLDRPGSLYHGTVRIETDSGLFAVVGTTSQWVDARRNVAREETQGTATVKEGAAATRTIDAVTLLTEGGRYVRETDGRITATPARTWLCHGAGIGASAVLGCPGPTEQSTTTVQQGAYAGRPAVVLVTAGTSRGSDQTYTFTNRLYLDPGTFLPVALEGAGQVDVGQIRPTRARRVYAHAFIPADAVPAGFFDPAALGYAKPNPEDPLDRATPDLVVYWLGAQFAGAAGLPPLILAQVDAVDPGRGPGYRFLLHYARADDPFGPPVLTLEEWSRPTWDTFLTRARGPQLWEGPCWGRQELDLPDGRATLFLGFTSERDRRTPGTAPDAGACPARPPDRFFAHASLGQTVVRVSAPEASGAVKSPYNTREGIAAVVHALQPRERR